LHLFLPSNNSKPTAILPTTFSKYSSQAISKHTERLQTLIPHGSQIIVSPPDSPLTDIDIDESKAERKIRLLTLATLSNTPSRTLSYSKIASSLEIPSEDVEVWLIDIIRAGLVEGKLSQARQELLVHRSTYRTFGKEDWEELDSRLEEWKTALEGVLASDQIAALREQEQPQTTAVVNGTSSSNQEIAT
jgi:translation initiation factor 3 subunit M